MEKVDFFQEGENALSQAEEYIDIDMCDDGLVFHYLQNAALNYLKALGKEFNLDVEGITSLKELVQEIESKTTVKFPDFIEHIVEMDETTLSTGCSTSLCFDMDFYGDIYEAVGSLREFVSGYITEG
jgi:hypothetical protein